jgi:mono/diheme cytochrome c family protein
MKFLVGLVLGLLILPVCLCLYVLSGSAPVATSDAPMPFEKLFATMGRNARIKREAPVRNVADFTAADLAAGAAVYQNECAFCHGLPKQPPTDVSKGMFPDPPQLFMADSGVTDDPAGVTYWKVKNGIRLSGMPGFKTLLSEDQMWKVTALLARADKLPPEVLDALKPAGAAVPAAPVPSSPPKL